MVVDCLGVVGRRQLYHVYPAQDGEGIIYINTGIPISTEFGVTLSLQTAVFKQVLQVVIQALEQRYISGCREIRNKRNLIPCGRTPKQHFIRSADQSDENI